jgi:hypothetical protein
MGVYRGAGLVGRATWSPNKLTVDVFIYARTWIYKTLYIHM